MAGVDDFDRILRVVERIEGPVELDSGQAKYDFEPVPFQGLDQGLSTGHLCHRTSPLLPISSVGAGCTTLPNGFRGAPRLFPAVRVAPNRLLAALHRARFVAKLTEMPGSSKYRPGGILVDPTHRQDPGALVSHRTTAPAGHRVERRYSSVQPGNHRTTKHPVNPVECR